MNSLTTPRAEARNALLGAASDTPGVHAANAVGTVLNPLSLAQVGGLLPGKFAAWRSGVNLDKMVGRLFSPDGVAYLRDMAGLSPGSRKAITATSEFLGQTGGRITSPSNNPLTPP